MLKNKNNIEFKEFKNFINNKLPFDIFYKSNIKNKKNITFEIINNEYKEDKSILNNNLQNLPDNVNKKSIQFMNSLKIIPNNNHIFKLRLFDEENENKSIEDLNDHILLNPKNELL